MILIADSGSTKTDWALKDRKQGLVGRYSTQGINPYQLTQEAIMDILREELAPTLPEGVAIEEVWFYGAGCTKEKAPMVTEAIRLTMAPDAAISVESDMLGAARALCGKERGIVCILGTGSNSCLYDGEKMVANVSPLGFILGDEGSGAYIGKRLVGDVLKHQLSEEMCRSFHEETGETAASIIQKTYREPMPNRFLAGLSRFCANHKEDKGIQELLKDCFRQFFVRNIRAYGEGEVVNFVGSIAHYYHNEIASVAAALGYKMGKVLRAPIDGLVEYHV